MFIVNKANIKIVNITSPSKKYSVFFVMSLVNQDKENGDS